MALSLPLEVAEVVIDHLHDSKPDLHTCCLVCRDWTHRSRFHIFQDVQIGHQDRLYSLSALLASQPALRPLVHSVTYSLDAPTKHQVVPVSLLTGLPNLRAWAFTGSPSGDRPMDFNRQSLSIFRKYATSIQELRISNATFSSCADFGRVLLAFTNIRTLTCATLQFAKRGTLDVVKTRLSKGSSLCSLTSWKMQEASTWLLLELWSGAPLQCLTVGLKGARKRESVDANESWQNQATITRLHSLTVLVEYTVYSASGTGTPFEGMVALFETLQLVSLRDLTIHMIWEGDGDSPLAFARAVERSGAIREEFLALEAAVLVLKAERVSIAVAPAKADQRDRLDVLGTTLHRAFPKLYARGMLDVKLQAWDGAALYTPSPKADPTPPSFAVSAAFPSYKRRSVLDGHSEWVEHLTVSPDSQWVATASGDNTVILWTARYGRVARAWLAHLGSVRCVAFSPDSIRIASVGDDSLVVVWSVSTDKQLAALAGHTGKVCACAWSPNGALLVSGAEDGTVRVWDAQTYVPVRTFSDLGAKVALLVFSPDGRWLAACTENHTCRFWEVEDRDMVLRHTKEASIVAGNHMAVGFDPASTKVATTSTDRFRMQVWDLASGELRLELKRKGKFAGRVEFSPNGQLLVTAADDMFGTMEIWDASSGEAIRTFEGHRDGLYSACFSPDGGHLLSASWDETIRLWRVEDGVCVAVLADHNDPVVCARFTPDGEMIASGDRRGGVSIRSVRFLIAHGEGLT